MPKSTKEQNHSQGQWWVVSDLIAGIAATPSQKNLLVRIQRHTNSRKGFAWMSQKELAREVGLSVPTVERFFQWAKEIGIVGVRRIRTGKGKADQHNEYWIILERLKELQTAPKHPSSVMDAQSEHPASVMGAHSSKHPSSDAPSTHHLKPEHPSSRAGAPITHDGGGLEVKQVNSNAGKETAGGEGSTATAPTPRGHKSEYQYPPEALQIVAHLKSMLRSYAFEFKGQPIPVDRLRYLRDDFVRDTDSIGIPFTQSVALHEKIVREFLAPPPPPPPIPRHQPKPTVYRVPKPIINAAQQVIDALTTAGATGRTTAQLADKLYGCGEERSSEYYSAQGRIVTLISRLRKNGQAIVTVGTNHTNKRYVLQG